MKTKIDMKNLPTEFSEKTELDRMRKVSMLISLYEYHAHTWSIVETLKEKQQHRDQMDRIIAQIRGLALK